MVIDTAVQLIPEAVNCKLFQRLLPVEVWIHPIVPPLPFHFFLSKRSVLDSAHSFAEQREMLLKMPVKYTDRRNAKIRRKLPLHTPGHHALGVVAELHRQPLPGKAGDVPLQQVKAVIKASGDTYSSIRGMLFLLLCLCMDGQAGDIPGAALDQHSRAGARRGQGLIGLGVLVQVAGGGS